jgi:hypothetical protein
MMPAASNRGRFGSPSVMSPVPYLQQDYVNNQALTLFTEAPKSAAFLRIAKDPSALSPSDIQSMLIGLAESDIKMATLQNLVTPLDALYTEAIKAL